MIKNEGAENDRDRHAGGNVHETKRQKIRHASFHQGLAQRETGDDDHDDGRRQRVHGITPGQATERQHYADTD